MDAERIAYLRAQAAEAHAMDRDAMNELLDEVERLQGALVREVERAFLEGKLDISREDEQ